MQPTVHNAGLALFVSARLWSVNCIPRSSVRVDQVYRIENSCAGDTPAAQGETLYGTLCAGCHLAPVGNADF